MFGRPLMRSDSGLVCICLRRVVLGIGRKPALFHAFMLMEKLNDAPQAGETDYPEDRGRNHIPPNREGSRGKGARLPRRRGTGPRRSSGNQCRAAMSAAAGQGDQ